MTKHTDSEVRIFRLPGISLVFLIFSLVFLSGCQDRTAAVLEAADSSTEELVSFSSEMEEPAEEIVSKEMIQVYICGAVTYPGVYELQKGDRVVEVIRMAGGLLAEADATAINQARVLSDGEQITILTEEEIRAGEEQQEAETLQQGASSGKINLNHATKEQLMNLSGIGEKRAADIIAYRESHGTFGEIEEIKNVSGIGDKLFEQIRELIEV